MKLFIFLFDLAYGRATSFIHCIFYSFTSKAILWLPILSNIATYQTLDRLFPTGASITHSKSSLRYEIYQLAQSPHTWSFLTRFPWSLIVKSKESKSILLLLYSVSLKKGRRFLDTMAFALFIEVTIFIFF